MELIVREPNYIRKTAICVVESLSWLDLVQMEVPLKIFILIPSSVYLPKLSNCQYNLKGRVKVIIVFFFKRHSFLQLQVSLTAV